MIKNYFYANDISETIAELLAENLPDEVKKIYRGDFTVLPVPEQLDECLPAVIIENMEAKHEMANEALGIMYSQYKYRIFYVYPYNFLKVERETKEATKIIEKVANILLFSNALEISIDAEVEEAGGIVVKTEVLQTALSPVEDEFLNLAGIPVAVGVVDAVVHFRTYESIGG